MIIGLTKQEYEDLKQDLDFIFRRLGYFPISSTIVKIYDQLTKELGLQVFSKGGT